MFNIINFQSFSPAYLEFRAKMPIQIVCTAAKKSILTHAEIAIRQMQI